MGTEQQCGIVKFKSLNNFRRIILKKRQDNSWKHTGCLKKKMDIISWSNNLANSCSNDLKC